MSGATYRIDVFRSALMPDSFPWKAHVRRLSDDETVAAGVGATPIEAERMARDLVKRMNQPSENYIVYVDDNGEGIYSVKA